MAGHVRIPKIEPSYESAIKGSPGWFPFSNTGHESPATKAVALRCECGFVVTLNFSGKGAHRINAQGVVSPSIVCPYGCSFHVFGTLEDWTFGAMP